jgi:hypothetical protein
MTSLWRKRAAADLGIAESDLSDDHYPTVDWRHWTFEQKRDLLETCRRDVPRVTMQNGVEIDRRFANPHDAQVKNDPYLKFLSKELYLGVLEADVMTESRSDWPPSSQQEWEDLRKDLCAALEDFVADPEEVTKGDDELSRQGHARRALEALEELEKAERWLLDECRDEHERAWLREALAVVAQCVYSAGRHTLAAQLKPFERYAVTGHKQTRRLHENRERHNAKQQQEVAQRQAFISKLLQTTKHKGTRRIEWLQDCLDEAGFGKLGQSTIYSDLEALRDKESRTG